MITVSTSMFFWSKEDRRFSQEISSVRELDPIVREFTLKSQWTGEEIVMRLARVERDIYENEIMYWVYEPAIRRRAGQAFTLELWND